MEEILRNTFATKQTAEVAFMHSFTSNIMPHIQMAHADEIHPTVGATFSVTMQNLEQMSPIFKRDSPTSFSWRTPTRRRLTTVVLRSICDIMLATTTRIVAKATISSTDTRTNPRGRRSLAGSEEEP